MVGPGHPRRARPNSFPIWSHDGKRLLFASNRANAKHGETNVFIADWVETKP